jgi:hypothetical protein
MHYGDHLKVDSVPVTTSYVKFQRNACAQGIALRFQFSFLMRKANGAETTRKSNNGEWGLTNNGEKTQNKS